jgi:hypothetical protein|tara:strand:+ start:460 stop:642 length:183 start_codon:yes stop_codon:yes gene_type:complete
MDPYATAAQPGPLNGADSFLSKYKYWFIGGSILIMFLLAVSIFTSMNKTKKTRRKRKKRR